MADDFALAKSPLHIANAPQGRGFAAVIPRAVIRFLTPTFASRFRSLGTFDNISRMQLNLIPYNTLTQAERLGIESEIRRHYWHIRNLRTGRFGQARLRKHYRDVSQQKKRLQLAGVSKREILDFLACCRLQCSARKQPFEPCQHCC